MAQKFSLESFKDALIESYDLRDSLAGTSDVLDFDNGTGLIHRENINRYLERYACKNAEELSDALWYGYGMYVKIV